MTLPNFIIFGAGRSGTTSMYEYLRQHPDVFMSPIKETNYYSPDTRPEIRPAKTREEYEALFAGVTTEHAVGEASPRYLNSPTAPRSIFRDIPQVKLIATLRNPVDRAYSAYLGRLRTGRESRPVHEALVPGSEPYERSFYFERLKRWLDVFPREQMLLLPFDDFAADSAGTMREVLAFIGVDPDVPLDTSVQHNVAAAPRSVRWTRISTRAVDLVRPFVPRRLLQRGIAHRLDRATQRPPDPLPPELRRRLVEAYRQDVLATGALIGRDLSHWLS